MNPELSQKLEARLEQSLEMVLSPKVLQMLHILNLPYIELIEKIEKEAEENVMLEVERADALFEVIRFMTDDKKIKKEADFSENPGLENIGDTCRTLEQTLLEQLDLENLNEDQEKIARLIIDNINDRGYIEDYPEVREKIMKEVGVSRPTVDKVLKIVQAFEPDGVGARDLKECLLIQIREYNFENYELEEVLTQAVSKCFDDLANKDLGKVAKTLGIPVEGVERIADFIRTNLTPDPGQAFAQEPRHVVPSFSVEKKGAGYVVTNLERTYGPLLKISPQYLKMMDDPKTDSKTLAFLKEKFQAAKELMGNIERRHETQEKIMEKIKETQLEFFSRGQMWLKPLLQKDLASEFDVHPSTISRTVSEKYIQTPKGLFPIKFLCPRSIRGFTHERFKSMIADIIKSEDKGSPLSDEEIREALAKEGTDVARRTVAAYRQELGIAGMGARGKGVKEKG